MNTPLQFTNNQVHKAFYEKATQRVHAYLATQKQGRFANNVALAKAITLGGLYLFISIAVFFVNDANMLLLGYAALGCLTVFVALNIGHDAAHYSLSKNLKTNKLLLYTFDILGASGHVWRQKHVHSHHIHVNIPDLDEELKQPKLIRMFPNAAYFSFHQFQHLYTPVLYLFYTLFWMMFRDYRDFYTVQKKLTRSSKTHLTDYTLFYGGKAFLMLRLLVLPMLILPVSPAVVLLAFLCFHLTASATAVLILLASHVGALVDFPKPDANGRMSNSWVMHNLKTTFDYGTKSRALFHLYGGFNHHLAHHFFPNICHIHYPKITTIIKEECAIFNLPYPHHQTLAHAIKAHFKLLRMRSYKPHLQFDL